MGFLGLTPRAGLDLKWEEIGVGTPKKKIVRRKNETETVRAMVKKLAKTKLIRAVRLRDFLEEGIFDLVVDGRRELAHVRRVFVMYEGNRIVRSLGRRR